MSLITVAYAAVAAGNLLLRVTGQPELPGYLDVGIEVFDRIASITRPGRENRRRRGAIEAALPQHEFPAADAGDVEAADRAVARVLSTVSSGDQLIAAVRDPGRLHALVAERAAWEEGQLLSEPARAVFRMILAASEAYVVKTALESGDLVSLAHRQELRDLADLAGDLGLLADRLSRVPAETVQLLAGEVLSLQPPVIPRGRPVEPSRLLLPTSGVFPFVDRGGLLEELVAWTDDPAPFSIQIVGGLGGSGKSRLAVELCRRRLRGGTYWRAGFLGSEGLATGIPALCAMPGGRLIVMDYAETRTLDVAHVLTSSYASATSLEPVRVLLLVRNPAVDPSGTLPLPEDPMPWVKALRAPRQEAANDLLDEATCVLLDADPLALVDRVRLFNEAITQLPRYVGPHAADATLRGVDAGFLDRPEFAQPLYVAMAAYLHVAGLLQVDAGTVGLFEGVLDHEAEYWRATAALSEIELDLNQPEHRLLVALATLTDAADDDEARRLLEQVRFLNGDANALRLGRAVSWLRRLYPLSGASAWGQLLPDRLGEYLVASQLASQPQLIGTVLELERDPDQWVRPLMTLTRACVYHERLAKVAAAIVDSQFVQRCQRCRDLASSPDPWASAAAIDALASLIDVVGSRLTLKNLLASSGVLGLGNRLTASLCLAVDRAAVQATEAGPDHAVRAEALNNYAISLAAVGQRDQAVDPAREAVDAYRVLAEANPAAYTPALASSLNNYAISLAEVGQRDQALDPAREAVELRRVLAEANPAAYTPALAMSLNTLADVLNLVGAPDEADLIRTEVDSWLSQGDGPGLQSSLAMPKVTASHQTANAPSRPIHH